MYGMTRRDMMLASGGAGLAVMAGCTAVQEHDAATIAIATLQDVGAILGAVRAVKGQFNPDDAMTPGNRAVCIGINAYPGNELQGCIDDVDDAAAYAVKRGAIKPEEIQLVEDSDGQTATTAKMQALVTWLRNTLPGYRALLWYSGHGAIDPDTNQQCICPVDFDWSPERMITAGWLTEQFQHLRPGVVCDVVFDSCHSGDMLREVAKRKYRHKTFPMSPAAAARLDNTIRLGRKHRTFRDFAPLQVGFIAGCQRDQTSADTADDSGRPCGALSHYLLKQLYLDDSRAVTQVVAATAADLKAAEYEQVPEASGGASGRPFLQ